MQKLPRGEGLVDTTDGDGEKPPRIRLKFKQRSELAADSITTSAAKKPWGETRKKTGKKHLSRGSPEESAKLPATESSINIQLCAVNRLICKEKVSLKREIKLLSVACSERVASPLRR